MNKLLFLDLETTGLEPTEDKILEVAAVVVDSDLNPLASFVRTVKHDEPLAFDKWAQRQHEESGLLKDCYMTGLPLRIVEYDLYMWLAEQFEVQEKVHLAGNSIHFDRSFIKQYMPTFEARLHHRMFDVSTLKVFWEMKNLPPAPRSEILHRALSDCYGSIEHAKYYTSFIQKEWGVQK